MLLHSNVWLLKLHYVFIVVLQNYPGTSSFRPLTSINTIHTIILGLFLKNRVTDGLVFWQLFYRFLGHAQRAAVNAAVTA